MSFPAFSGLFASLMAAAAAAPDEIPTCKTNDFEIWIVVSNIKSLQQKKSRVCYNERWSAELVAEFNSTNHQFWFHTSRPSFKASSLAISIASSLDILKAKETLTVIKWFHESISNFQQYFRTFSWLENILLIHNPGGACSAGGREGVWVGASKFKIRGSAFVSLSYVKAIGPIL